MKLFARTPPCLASAQIPAAFSGDVRAAGGPSRQVDRSSKQPTARNPEQLCPKGVRAEAGQASVTQARQSGLLPGLSHFKF
jgi:hypothetical protein